jgi:hypothetical protein
MIDILDYESQGIWGTGHAKSVTNLLILLPLLVTGVVIYNQIRKLFHFEFVLVYRLPKNQDI